jgi:hypothetical protein
MPQGSVGEQGVDRCQPVVAGADAVVPVLFEVLQERGDERGVQVGDVELAGLGAGSLAGEAEQQPPAVAIAGDRVGAGVLLLASLSVK